ncbi:2-phospho-L-lactate transferase CofD family protein [Pseudoalteromonas obscura]|uniref:2-phospho-L-lactate transferase CofD family protein n=1 Tax=Pseudoalteromonas obscura TaxID=3048491 RepID=A0ABT7ENK6_9GAMM|nr:2-phospho-L-lactate transferase CofD family protein [Pseudoalteromonas sp. P94(2023)]MDK2596636.1 2-phospho-L-lactate transferase CofD family protein [Pseudoalteromonas sp. P94(2023)]
MNVVFVGAGQDMLDLMKSLKPLCQNLSAICATPEASFDIDNKCALLSYSQLEILQSMSLALSSSQRKNKTHHVANLELLSLMCHTPTEALTVFNQSINNSTNSVLPMSDYATDLIAITYGGETVVGAKNINRLNALPKEVFLSKDVDTSLDAIAVIEDADLIIFGPCNPFTDLLPLLLIQDIKNAVLETSASRLFIDMPQSNSELLNSCTSAEYLHWMSCQLGYQFFDISISNQFADIISYHYKESMSSKAHDTYHNNGLDMMNTLFELPSLRSSNPLSVTAVKY